MGYLPRWNRGREVMPRFIDMSGKVSGSWTILECAGKDAGGQYHWLCKCSCGSIHRVAGKALRNGHSLGCRDCGKKKIAEMKPNLIHGMTGSNEYRLYGSAKGRAKKKGLEFDIELSDIVIPDKCPLLEVYLTKGGNKITDSSPTLDRRDSSRGYVKDNIWVISNKANRMKNNASLEELILLVNNLKENT